MYGKEVVKSAWGATLPVREFAGSAVSKAGQKLEELKKDYLALGLPMKVAIPAGTAGAIGAIGYGVSTLMDGPDEPSLQQQARVGQIQRQAATAPVHNAYKAPSPGANDAYDNLSALALAEERVRISKKVAPGKEEEAIQKLRQEYDLLRGYGESLGGIYRD